MKTATLSTIPVHSATPNAQRVSGEIDVPAAFHRSPRYLQLAQTLVAEIESGAYPVGSLIPTEMELCEQFGASRFTVRSAIKQLVALGMVTRQAGVGTRVVGPRQPTAYRQTLEGLADIHRYTGETSLDIRSKRTIEVSGELAERLGARPGENWLAIEALRRSESGTVFAFTEIFLHPAFRGLSNLDDDDHLPIYVRIEQQFGERIDEIRQLINGVAIEPRIATMLEVAHGSPGLQVSRTYLNAQGEIVELAINIHPADRFAYAQTFRRQEPTGG